MKKIRTLILMFIAIFSLGLLVSCGSNKVSIEITSISAMRTRIGVNVIITDNDELITDSSVYCRIYDEDDNLINSQLFDENLSSEQTVTFNNLSEETKYKVVVKATVDGKSTTYYNQYVTTSNVGGTADNPVEISTVQDFKNIAYDDDAYYVLKNDIEFGTEEEYGSFTSLFYTSSDKFSGHLEGNGYTISNISIDNNNTYCAIFGHLATGATISNLNIKNVSLKTTKGSELYLGVVAGVNEGTIENVNVSNVEITHEGTGSSKAYVGGFVGVNTNTIKNSSVTNVKMTLRSRLQSTVGGFVGCNGGITHTAISTALIDNSYVVGANITNKFITTAKKTKDDKVSYFQYTGGFVGETNVDITNCYAEATIEATASFVDGSVMNLYDISLGGFAGRIVNGCKVVGVASVANINFETTDAYEVYVGALAGAAYDAIISDAQAILTGTNSVKDTADYSNDEDEDIKEMYAKAFDLIGVTKDALANKVSSANNVGYTLLDGASITASTEENPGYLTISSDTKNIDQTNLSEALKAFLAKYIA